MLGRTLLAGVLLCALFSFVNTGNTNGSDASSYEVVTPVAAPASPSPATPKVNNETAKSAVNQQHYEWRTVCDGRGCRRVRMLVDGPAPLKSATNCNCCSECTSQPGCPCDCPDCTCNRVRTYSNGSAGGYGSSGGYGSAGGYGGYSNQYYRSGPVRRFFGFRGGCCR